MSSLPPIHRWDAVPAPRAAVQIIHGMAEHGGRYARFAGELNRAGFVVWAHDHRGHGGNVLGDVGLGHFGDANGWRLLVDDAWAVSERLAAEFKDLPQVVFAHSMGSFVAQQLIAERGTAYRGVILSGSNGRPGTQEALARVLARAQHLALGSRRRGAWLDTAVMGAYNRRFAPNRSRADWLSRDDAEVDAYLADPLCGFTLTAQSWLDFLVAKASLGTSSQLKGVPRALPVHLIAGTRDPVGEQAGGVRRLLRAYRDAGLTRLSYRFYDGARHELLHETNRDEVTAELIGWLATLGL